jgi:hypothetical protein
MVTGTGLRVCITPDRTGGVNWQTLVGTQVGTVDTLVPDGSGRAISDATCTGTERSEWSTNGAHVFRLTDVTCGTEGPRRLSSVSFLAPGPVLVSVQFVQGGSIKSVRVQRYRRGLVQTLADGTLAPQAAARVASPAPPGVGEPWSVDDVIEASRRLPPDAVQAVLTEAGGPFDLRRKTLLAMHGAGVSGSVIDLMVALTYPKKLVVQRAGGDYSSSFGAAIGGDWYDPFNGTMVSASSMFADCYSPFGYGYGSYYDRCRPYAASYGGPGFGYAAYYPGYAGYSYGGGWVIVDPGPTTPEQPAVEGRVVNGHGYTQVRPREPDSAAIGTGGGPGTSRSSAASSGDSSGVSSGGYSSGSSSDGSSGGGSSGGDSGGRTAIPR